MIRMIRFMAAGAVLAALSGCAHLGALGQAIQPPTFTSAPGQQAELRLAAPTAMRPLGGATVRLWAQVENPNPIGLTLSTLAGNLFLEGVQAAEVEFPLGMPLQPGEAQVIPLDITVSFADLPGLADAATRALTGAPLRYRFDGQFGVDAGLLGQPTFGPMTLLQGEMPVLR